MAFWGDRRQIRAQLARPEHFAAAWTCVDECFCPGTPSERLLTGLAEGRTERLELAGGAFALLQAYATKSRAEGRWETHRAYIDVQAVVAGIEFMEVAPRADLTVVEDLTPAKDVIFYAPHAGGSVLRFGPGSVGVYFPTDAHMGGLAVASPVLVRKVVVKVPVGPFAG